jgi:hypothetical protein
LLKCPSLAARLRALAIIPALWPGATGQEICFDISPAHSGQLGELEAFINNSKVLLHFAQ